MDNLFAPICRITVFILIFIKNIESSMRNYIGEYVLTITAAMAAATIHSCDTGSGCVEDNARMERIVSHYTFEDQDTQKLMAARFLLDNMQGEYSSVPLFLDSYEELFARLADMRSDDGRLTGKGIDAIRSMRNNVQGGYDISYDTQTVSADFLISGIDAAFEQWRSTPWAKEYSFNDFCRWVLPYRVDHEKLENWRNDALSFHRPEEDSLKTAGDMWELGRLLINTSGVNFSSDVHLPFDLSFRQMDMVKEGHCGAMSDYTTMLLRSRGIPSSTESTPAWGNRSSGHSWNAIIAPDGTTMPIGFYGDNTVRILDDHRLAKVYRSCYGMATETLPFKYKNSESIPAYFSGMDMIDVTGQYDMPTVDIAIDNLDESVSKLAWLCTFNNSRWIPVACAEIIDGRALFRDMGNGQGFNHDAFRFEGGDLGIVYLPAYYKNGGIIPASAPVLAKEDGSVTALVANADALQSVTVKRKYPLFRSFCNDATNMTGTRFEASNSADFRDAVTLFTIDSLQPHPLTPHNTDHADKKFRYVRYRFPDMHLPDTAYSVCRLCFYSGDELLAGKTIYGTDSGSIENPANLFDGKMLTYCKAEKPSGAWVGLDLGTPRNITSIKYMPRTDDNDIWPGDVYEMFYWNNGWQSAGRKTASEYKLTWDNIPSGTLYLVIDRTKGVENRIFTYDNHTVEWW